jgi:hemoglobin-like flavoprotein
MKEDDKSPILKTWRNVYIFIAAVLVAQIVLYYFFTKNFE